LFNLCTKLNEIGPVAAAIAFATVVHISVKTEGKRTIMSQRVTFFFAFSV
jgi:hypothetical protein